MTTTETLSAQPLKAALDHDVAMRLAAGEYDRFLALLRSLRPDDWA
jgi:hypothetical protein